MSANFHRMLPLWKPRRHLSKVEDGRRVACFHRVKAARKLVSELWQRLNEDQHLWTLLLDGSYEAHIAIHLSAYKCSSGFRAKLIDIWGVSLLLSHPTRSSSDDSVSAFCIARKEDIPPSQSVTTFPGHLQSEGICKR